MAAKPPHMGREDKACYDSAERTERECKAHFVFERSDGLLCGVGAFAEVVVVLKEGETALLLRVLKPRDRLMLVLGVKLRLMRCVGLGKSSDERVVRRGKTKLPASPHDAAVSRDVPARDTANEVHAKSLSDEFHARGQRKTAGNRCENGGKLVDGLAAEVAHGLSMRVSMANHS